MKFFLVISGLLIVIFIGIVPLKRKLAEYEVQYNGKRIEAVITSIPRCIGTKTSPVFYFRYNNIVYNKTVGCNFSDNNKPGDKIILKHIDGTDIFLFENEKIEEEFISLGILSLLGIIAVIYGIRKK